MNHSAFQALLAQFLAVLEDTLNDKYNRVSVTTVTHGGAVRVILQCDGLVDIYYIVLRQQPYFIRTYFGV